MILADEPPAILSSNGSRLPRVTAIFPQFFGYLCQTDPLFCFFCFFCSFCSFCIPPPVLSELQELACFSCFRKQSILCGILLAGRTEDLCPKCRVRLVEGSVHSSTSDGPFDCHADRNDRNRRPARKPVSISSFHQQPFVFTFSSLILSNSISLIQFSNSIFKQIGQLPN